MEIIDLKEDIEFSGYEIEQQTGALAKEFILVSANLDIPYKVGQDINLNIFGVDETVHIVGIRQRAAETGWVTEIHGFGEGYDLMVKAPKKARSYLSMNNEEYSEFIQEYGSKLGKSVDHLDYVPMIRGADDYGCGGWTAIKIIKDLVGQLGLSLETNIMDYDIRQFTIEAGRPYIEAITEIVNMFDPAFYLVENVLFVLEGLAMESAVIGGIYEPGQVVIVSQEIIDATPPEQLVVKGVLGEFFPEKYRGYAGNTEFYVDDCGDVFSVGFEMYGIPRKDDGNYQGEYGAIEYERRIARDIHGNDYFQYYEKRITTELIWLQEDDVVVDPYYGIYEKINWSDYYDYPTREEEEFDEHILIHWKYAHPVEDVQERVISGMVWVPPTNREIDMEDVDGPLFEWFDMLEYEYTLYNYTGGGQQTEHYTVKYELCLTDWDGYEEGSFVTPLTQLERAESEEYVMDEDVWTEYFVKEWTSRIQITLSRETYGLVTIGQTFEGLKEDEVTGDLYLDYKAITPSIEIVQAGGHQGNATELRKMETYFATGLPEVGNPEEADQILNSESKTVFVNSSNWDHLEQIHERVAMFAGYKKIMREYQLPLQYPLAVGLPVVIADMSVGVDQTLKVPGQVLGDENSGIIIGYRISKDAGGPSVNVGMTVRASLIDQE